MFFESRTYRAYRPSVPRRVVRLTNWTISRPEALTILFIVGLTCFLAGRLIR